MANLVTEAFAHAKEVKAAAMANAKTALEETFQPTLQRMISSKLAEEEGEGEFDDVDIDINYGEEGMEGEEEGGDVGFGSFDTGGEEEMSAEETAPEEEEGEDLELEALIRELDGEEEEGFEDDMMEEGEEDAWSDPIEDPIEDPIQEGEGEFDDEMIEEMLESLLREEENLGDLNGPNNEDGSAFTETEPSSSERNLHLENRRLRNQLKSAQKKLNESLRAITTYKTTINEVNLLNAKLMYTTKTLRQFNLNEHQQMRILESFDRARTVREVKLVYATISESLNKKASKEKRRVTEGSASRTTKQINPKTRKNSLTEGVLDTSMVNRFQQLAGIKNTDGGF